MLRKHTAKSTKKNKKKTIVLKGKRYKAQWWSSNYTVDPHWSLTKHGITLRLFILGMLGKIYHHAKNCVSTTPLNGLRPIGTTQSLIMCPQGAFLSVFLGKVWKGNIKGFKICYLTYLFSFLNEFKLPPKTSQFFFYFVSQVQRLSYPTSTSEPQQQR